VEFREDASVTDPFYDGRLQLATVAPTKVEFVAGKTNGNGVARFPFARSIAVGRSEFIFPGIDNAVQVYHDGAANRVRGGFTKNLGFGLTPIFEVVAFGLSPTLVKLSRPSPDGFSLFRGIVLRSPLHTTTASRFQVF
jgi:hypothetical protein